MESILDLGINIISIFQRLGDWLIQLMSVITFLGSEEFFLLILPALYWCVDTSLGVRVGVILMVNGAINAALKLVFQGPRPSWYSEQVKAYVAETSFGVPSGHTQFATGVWGMIAASLKKWWAWLVAVSLILLIGLSRIFLAAHFPHDVLFGWAVGALVLWLTLRMWDPVVAWLRRCTLSRQIMLAFVFSILLALLSLPGYSCAISAGQPLAEWEANAAHALPVGVQIDPVTLQEALTNAGAFFGLAAGLAWLVHVGGFSTTGPVEKRILRYVVGVVGVVIIRYGLKAIFPEGDYWLPYLLRYVRYALIGLWISAGAPALFLSLKLVGGPRSR